LGYKQAIEDVLKARLKGHANALEKWKERERTGSRTWVNEQCGRGQGPFLTEESVLCYCMTYMHYHFEAAVRVLDPFVRILDRNSVVAMLDIGCGPMTAALALAESNIAHRRQPLTLKYIGVDISTPMLNIAEAFSEQEHCFAQPDDGYWRFLSSIDDITERRLEKLTRGATHVVVVLSYLLAQNGLSLKDVKTVAGVLATLKSLTRRSQQLWIAYTNAAGVYGNKYAYFISACRDVGVRFESTTLTRRKHDFWQHRLARYDVVEEMAAKGENLEFLLTEFL
jgi:SAM-dependent methyltransferase